ncbi:MAG TPA: hypothetical protein VLF43_00545 [Candidatus Saccharimonadales bacterium]|nr:hypothetical protein [Candidatus Saccharimonadales bacterium]
MNSGNHSQPEPVPAPFVPEAGAGYNYWRLPGESPELYAALGVVVFKKYMPTSGDLMVRRFPSLSILPSGVEGSRESRLEKLVDNTKILEKIHLGTTALTGVIQAGVHLMPGYNKYTDAALAGVQLITNVYPIMVQRYNRLRAFRVLDHLHKVD